MANALEIFRALGDPTRLRILALLRSMELSVGELAQVLGQSQPRVSRHVKILVDAELAERRKEGSWVFVALGDREAVEPMTAALDRWTAEEPDPWVVADVARLAAVRADRAASAAAWFEDHAGEWDAIRSLHVADSEIEEAMVLEVEQRHHEIAQVSTVLKQLEELIDSKNKAEADARHAEIERKIRRTVYKMKMGGVTSCFEGWRDVIAEQKRTDALLRKIVNSFRMKGVTMCFGAWKKDWELKKDADAVGRREADAAKNFDRIRQIEEKMEMQDEAMHAILEEKVLLLFKK